MADIVNNIQGTILIGNERVTGDEEVYKKMVEVYDKLWPTEVSTKLKQGSCWDASKTDQNYSKSFVYMLW